MKIVIKFDENYLTSINCKGWVSLYYDLLINSIVILFLCGFAIMIDLSIQRKYASYILGVMFSLITIFSMNSKIMVLEGHFYDFRHVIMTMAGFIGGPVTALIAAILSSLYRYNAGGSGSMGGISVIVFFACFGGVFGKYEKRRQNGKRLLFWFIAGIIMALVLIFIIALIHLWKGGSFKVVRVVVGPFLIITPLATTVLFNFYYWTHDFFGKASILNTIMNYSPINLMIFDAHGPILFSKNLLTQSQFDRYTENPSLLYSFENTLWNSPFAQEITTEDGRHLEADLSRFQMPNGEYACVAIINDVTERKKEQELLRAAKERFSKVFQLGPHMMTIIRKSDYHYVDVNRRFLEVSGFEYKDVIGKTPMEIGMVESNFRKMIKILEVEGSVRNFEDALVTHSGLKGTVIISAEEIKINNQECILFASNDITEMKQMEMERVEQLTKHLMLEADLSKSNQLIADIIDNMPDGFFAINGNYQFTYINRAGEIAFGKSRDNLLGLNIAEVFWADDVALRHFREVMSEKRSVAFEIVSGTLGNKWLEISAYPTETGLTCYFRDISSRKTSEIELARLDRLNLVGQLAAGIGHEIRNPMTTVRGYLQLLGEKPEYEAKKSTFELMISELDRANSIITEFLSLARIKQSELKSQNLNEILNNLYPLLEADTFTQNKQICFEEGKIPNLELNRKEITQLVLNLTRNGLEAMQEGGCLTIKSYLENGKVVLAIKDEGCGISSEDRNKLGTPFYTTKDNGTGLGLAMCYRIAESHKAKIYFDSSSRGTTFYIIFPVPDKDQEQSEMIA